MDNQTELDAVANADLPEIAFLDNAHGSRVDDCDAPLIAVKRGEAGYWPIYTRRDADQLNAVNGVTPREREAMFAGSMFGWNVRAADPAAYNVDGSCRR